MSRELAADLSLIGQLILGLTFALSAFSKLRASGSFARALVGLWQIPRPAARPAAFLVAGAETAAAIGLLAMVRIDEVLVLTLLLLLGFALTLIVNALRSRPFACHCFGSDDTPRPRRDLVRVGLLLGCLGVTRSTASGLEASIPAVFSAAGLMVISFWLLHSDELISLHAAKALRRITPRRVAYRGLPLKSPFAEVR